MNNCIHHWVLSEPTLKFNFSPRGKMDLSESTEQVCKLCGLARTNVCEVPPEYHDWHAHDPAIGRRREKMVVL